MDGFSFLNIILYLFQLAVGGRVFTSLVFVHHEIN